MTREPLATYRIQLNEGFTFHDAAAIVPYLAELGVTHVYCSPYLQSGAGSTHGYDVLDHTRLDVDLGGAEGHATMVAALQAAGLSHIVDIVPNHMAISSRRNRWWWDVLKNGRLSKYATFFDIDWDPPEPKLAEVILMPILGDHYGRVLKRGEIKVLRNDDELVVTYFEHELPLSPTSVRDLIEFDGSAEQALGRINDDPDAMHELLEAQHYRLAYWRTAGHDLDYRRFFDINTLVALRQEDPEVFEATHELILSLIEEGSIDGVRVDHIDGLREPRAYLERLRAGAPSAYITVEKILETDERLPGAWPVQGTTGYDFLNDVLRVLVDPRGERALTDLYREVTGESASLEDVVGAKKTMATRELLQSDLERLTALFVDVCEDNRDYRDFTRHELRECLRATVTAFPVYRTYVEAAGKGATDDDHRWIDSGIESARSNRPDLDPELFDLLHEVLLGRVEGHAGSELLLRFQQFSGPVMAKGMEDTVFYNFNRFIALNEVGGDPGRFGSSVSEFHDRCVERARSWPRSMLATSTHDTKRSDDVRARLCVLSEVPDRWTALVSEWMGHVDRFRTNGLPDRNAIYLFFQSLVGAWPLEVSRAAAHMEKATKEAKAHTSWIDPDPDYDSAVQAFVRACYEDQELLRGVEAFVDEIADAGRVNSLAQTLLKLVGPGVPDIYQGSELWDLSLVDPDNRRPVDYDTRRELLTRANSITAEQAWDERASGVPKMLVTSRALRVIRDQAEALAQDDYEPIEVTGDAADHVVAFARGGRVACVVPRLWTFGRSNFDRATVDLGGGSWRNVFTDAGVTGSVSVEDIWRGFPVALLVKENP